MVAFNGIYGHALKPFPSDTAGLLLPCGDQHQNSLPTPGKRTRDFQLTLFYAESDPS